MIIGKKMRDPVQISDQYQAEYRIEEEKIQFVKYLGTEEEYQIPDQIENRPVTEVAEYAFAEHRNLYSVTLPPGLLRIGRHAFYNCRGLQELILSDQVTEIEDGAFKNCKLLSRLELHTKRDHKLVIKNILMDSTEGMHASIIYEEKEASERGEFYFPPYLVEYEENTPARICEKQAYGSGERYRHCLYDGQLNYDQYDQLLDYSIAVDNIEHPIQTTIGRLMYPYELKEEAKVLYEEFLKERIEDFLIFYIKREDFRVLEWLLTEKYLTKEESNLAAELCRKYDKNGLL
ncbi:MAG: leucine-rich repeat domain-containing protein, partial [Lachnospiraceae bacterium]|nr:leucine-rich repeat domain-containing protein [Lachnospiraceae bacterium]